MSKPYFSIIIPLYNAQEYIIECLESCIKQSFTNIEILVVDDCGMDNSINIVQRYAKEDLRISIIHHKVNLGVFCARNTGVSHAQGSYVLFLDSDDFLDLRCCEMVYNELTQNTVDIFHFIIGNYPIDSTRLISGSQKLLKNNEILKDMFLRNSDLYSLCGKAIRVDLLKKSIVKLNFVSERVICSEDLLLLFVIANLAQSSKGIESDLVLYFYRKNEKSATRIMTDEMIHSRVNANNRVISYLNKIDSIGFSENKYYFLAKREVVNILRYYNAFQSRLLIEKNGILPNYIYNIIWSLFYKFRFKNLIRLVLYCVSLGVVKK